MISREEPQAHVTAARPGAAGALAASPAAARCGRRGNRAPRPCETPEGRRSAFAPPLLERVNAVVDKRRLDGHRLHERTTETHRSLTLWKAS